jgi:hypothetical protein
MHGSSCLLIWKWNACQIDHFNAQYRLATPDCGCNASWCLQCHQLHMQDLALLEEPDLKAAVKEFAEDET